MKRSTKLKAYRYKALDQEGNLVKGILRASTPQQLKWMLSAQRKELISSSRDLSLRRKTPTPSEVLHFFIQWSALLKARIPIVDALKSLLEEFEGTPLQQLLEESLFSLENGHTLSLCFKKYSHWFNEFILTLIQMGEETGELEVALDYLILHLKSQQSLKDKTRKALLYPLSLFGCVALAISVLFTVLIPQVEGFFHTLGMDLPLVTRSLLGFSRVLHVSISVVFWLGGGLGASLLLGILYHRSTNLFFSSLVLKIPLWGKLKKDLLLMHFFTVLSILLKSNVSLLKALDIAIKSIKNIFLKDQLMLLRNEVQKGHKISLFLKNHWFISPFVYRMVRVGEQSGSLNEAFENICHFYDREIEVHSSTFLKLLEPCLLLALGGVLLWVTLGVFYPLYHSFGSMDL